MMGFAISLRSKRTTDDWERCVRLLEGTLRSILNQTVGGFRAVVGCHEIPDGLTRWDERISFEPIDYPVPIYVDEWEADKQRKREIATLAAYRAGCHYVMPLDADDLVSNRLVDYVLTEKPEYGCVVTKGYEYSLANDSFSVAPRFNRICGSCGIFRWRDGELPEEPWQFGSFAYRDQVNSAHPSWLERGERIGRPLVAVPFPAVAYVRDTGQNLSVWKGEISRKRKIMRKIMPSIRKDEELRKEFGLLADPVGE